MRQRSNDTASVEAIDPILASAIEITVDPSATTATLAVHTTIPVACAVIYGSNDTYGSVPWPTSPPRSGPSAALGNGRSASQADGLRTARQIRRRYAPDVRCDHET